MLSLLAANACGRAGGAKSGRGSRALLIGVLSCARCGRRLADVLARINDLPQSRLDELLPWKWKRLRQTAAAA